MVIHGEQPHDQEGDSRRCLLSLPSSTTDTTEHVKKDDPRSASHLGNLAGPVWLAVASSSGTPCDHCAPTPSGPRRLKASAATTRLARADAEPASRHSDETDTAQANDKGAGASGEPAAEGAAEGAAARASAASEVRRATAARPRRWRQSRESR